MLAQDLYTSSPQLDPQQATQRRKRSQEPPDPQPVLWDVREFVDLARSGAYLAGDRRVSPKERSGWRVTLRRPAKDAQAALRDDDPDTAAAALELLIDLACDTREFEWFRSEDPMQAAGFVVSDAAEQLWSRMRDHPGFHGFAERAAPQLVRWESPYGWTRYGFGSIAEKETTLATVLGGMLQILDHWESFATQYLGALDAAAGRDATAAKGQWRSRDQIRTERARSLADVDEPRPRRRGLAANSCSVLDSQHSADQEDLVATFKQSEQLTLSNPAGLYDPSDFGYSHVANVAAGARVVFIAGQGGQREDGSLPESFTEQVAQAIDNLLTALASVGAGPKDVAKTTVYIVDHTEDKLGEYGSRVTSAWGDAPPPASTLVSVPGLALDSMLFEIEAVAVIPV